MLHAKIISNLLYCRYRLSRGQSSKSTTTPTPPRMHSRDRCSGTTEPAARRRLHCSAVLISDLTCTLMAYLGRTTNWSAHAGNPRNLLGLILLAPAAWARYYRYGLVRPTAMLVPGTRREPRARDGIRMRMLRARVRAEPRRRAVRPPRRRLLLHRVRLLGALQLAPQPVDLGPHSLDYFGLVVYDEL